MLDSKLLGGQFFVPVFVIQGAEDFTAPTSLAKTYLNSLHAPRKAFVTIDGAGHFAVFTRQDVFLKELRARVLPLDPLGNGTSGNSTEAASNLAIYNKNMIKATEKIWHNGRFINWDDAKIHVLAHVTSYGSSVFEGVRCYSTRGRSAHFPASASTSPAKPARFRQNLPHGDSLLH